MQFCPPHQAANREKRCTNYNFVRVSQVPFNMSWRTTEYRVYEHREVKDRGRHTTEYRDGRYYEHHHQDAEEAVRQGRHRPDRASAGRDGRSHGDGQRDRNERDNQQRIHRSRINYPHWPPSPRAVTGTVSGVLARTAVWA